VVQSVTLKNVRFGSKADVCSAKHHVNFAHKFIRPGRGTGRRGFPGHTLGITGTISDLQRCKERFFSALALATGCLAFYVAI
jgi:hypothetical protein